MLNFRYGASSLAIAVAMFGAQAAFAQTATTSADLQGEAETFCDIAASAELVHGGDGNYAGGVLDFGTADFVDVTTGMVIAQQSTLQVASTCNYEHQLSLASTNGNMTQGTANVVTGFASAVPYTATAQRAALGTAATITTAGTAGVKNSVTTPASAVDISVTIDVPSPTEPLAAAVYSDTLTIQVGVAL